MFLGRNKTFWRYMRIEYYVWHILQKITYHRANDNGVVRSFWATNNYRKYSRIMFLKNPFNTYSIRVIVLTFCSYTLNNSYDIFFAFPISEYATIRSKSARVPVISVARIPRPNLYNHLIHWNVNQRQDIIVTTDTNLSIKTSSSSHSFQI